MAETVIRTIWQSFSQSSWQITQEVLKTLALQQEKNGEIGEMGKKSQEILDYVQAEVYDYNSHAQQSLLTLLDVNSVKQMLVNPQNVETLKSVKQQLDLLYCALNLGRGVEIYEPLEVADLFAKPDSQYDIKRLIKTIAQSIKEETTEQYGDVFLTYLTVGDAPKQTEFIWEETLLYAMMVDFCWYNFSHCYYDEQEAFLQNYFYKGILVGAPVKHILTDVLYRSYDVFEFLLLHNFFITSLENNKEDVPVDLKNNTTSPLKQLLTTFAAQAREKINDGYGQQQFINHIYENQTGRDRFVEWLQETFYIVTQIRLAQLVTTPRYKELTEVKEFDDEKEQILTWFLVKEDWPKLANYYHQTKVKIPLRTVLYDLSLVFSLDSEDTIKRMLDFSTFLQNEKILKPDQFIVEFHEKAKTFQWNEDLLY